MRDNSGLKQINKFITNVGELVKVPLTVYLSGGATAVMFDIRETTIDVDIKFEPEEMQMYKAIQVLKEKLNMNIELASPLDFIPALPQWKERSIFITANNKVSFYHLDLYSQVIAKVQRGWKKDLTDAEGFMNNNLDKNTLKKLFLSVKSDFIKFPAVNVNELEKKLNSFIGNGKKKK